MPGSTSALRPLDRELFLPSLNVRTDAFRVRRLIEVRQSLIRRYAVSYGGVADTLELVRNESHPALRRMSSEQRRELEEQLVSARDEVARGFTQAIARAENDANEFASGTFPRGDEPFQSFDLGEWAGRILDGLIGILHGLADIFGAFGMDTASDAMESGAAGLEALERYGEEQGWWPKDDD